MSVAPAGCNSCLPLKASPSMRQTCLVGIGPNFTLPCARLVAINPIIVAEGFARGGPRRESACRHRATTRADL